MIAACVHRSIRVSNNDKLKLQDVRGIQKPVSPESGAPAQLCFKYNKCLKGSSEAHEGPEATEVCKSRWQRMTTSHVLVYCYLMIPKYLFLMLSTATVKLR
jgi:hypothetical protein